MDNDVKNTKMKFGLTVKIVVLAIVVVAFVVANVVINKRQAEEEVHRIYTNVTEYVRTIDCAEIIDANPNATFKLTFELKAEVPGEILVYLHNGSDRRYVYDEYITATEEFKEYTLEVTPVMYDSSVKEAYLSFHGTYGTGVIPSIRYIKLEPIS